MLFMVWVGACWPFTWVMVVGVGCFGWCVFQWCVAVVCASRRVPGVLAVVGVVGWLVSCVGVVLAWLCVCGVVFSGVVCSGVGVGVCVSWFRMLTCSGLFLVFLVLFVCLVNNGVAVCGGCGAVFVGVWGWFGSVGLLGCCLLFVWCALLCAPVFACGGAGRKCLLACVVVWVRGVLLGVAGYPCGWVMLLLAVVWGFRLM